MNLSNMTSVWILGSWNMNAFLGSFAIVYYECLISTLQIKY